MRLFQFDLKVGDGYRQIPPLPNIWPFTDSLTDLRFVLLILPFLWLLGLEQIVPPLLLMVAFGKLLLLRRRIRSSFSLILFLIFLAWQFVSATSIEVGSNWIIFGRNFISYLSGWITAVLIINGVRQSRDLIDLFRGLLWLSLLTTLIGILFAMGFFPSRFEALLVSDLLPEGIKQSQFVQENIIQRIAVYPQARLAAITYPRVSAIFLYPTGAASGFLLLLFILYFRVKAWRRGRLLGTGVLLLTLIVFLLTAARLAIIALLLVICIGVCLHWVRRYKLPRGSWVLISLILITFLLVLIFLPDSPLISALNSLFVSTRAESFAARLAIYVETLLSWQERPLIGWGTPRTVATIALAPAGTHGEYLSILYRFGLIGFLLYLSFWAGVWLQLGHRLLYVWRNGRSRTLLFYLTVTLGLLSINLNGLANGLHFDMVVILLLWTFIGLAHIPSHLVSLWLRESSEVSSRN